MYDELRTVLRYNYDVLNMSGSIFGNATSVAYWPEQLLNSWMEYIDEAYKLAGDDAGLRTKILRESIFVRYLQLKLYITDGEDVEGLRAQFIKDAMMCGIEKASEHKAITATFTD